MTAPGLMDELEGVVRLADKATPGPWHRHTDCPGLCCWHMFHSEDGIYGPEPDGAEPSLINSPEMSEGNATYIVALNNWFRTHHAEIADMAWRLEAAERDAARYRWLRNKSLGQFKHPICVSQSHKVGYGMSYVGPLIGDSLDAAIDAATQEGEG